MKQIGKQQKLEILARVSSFNFSGFENKLTSNVCYHYQSFVGRDYKTWAQMALQIIGSYLRERDKEVWLSLSQVPNIHACTNYYMYTGIYNCLC